MTGLATRWELQGTTAQNGVRRVNLGLKGIATLVVFLASERTTYITGTTIQVDGGYVRSLL